jgi:hypothetical protein
MEKSIRTIDIRDNGGRRRIKDRRFLVTVPYENERRTNWERRSGYDRRLRRILGSVEDRRSAEKGSG